MGLSRLLYISTKNPMPPGEIFRIQEEGERNNARDDITGVLLFNRSYFLQYLEGERELVTRAFTLIAGDPRHCQVNLLDVGDVAERSYPLWSMGLLDAGSASVRAALEQAVPGGLFMPANLTGERALVMMQRLQLLHLAPSPPRW